MNNYGGYKNVTIYFSSPSSLWLRSIWNRSASIVSNIQIISKTFYSFDPNWLGFKMVRFLSYISTTDSVVYFMSHNKCVLECLWKPTQSLDNFRRPIYFIETLNLRSTVLYWTTARVKLISSNTILVDTWGQAVVRFRLFGINFALPNLLDAFPKDILKLVLNIITVHFFRE